MQDTTTTAQVSEPPPPSTLSLSLDTTQTTTQTSTSEPRTIATPSNDDIEAIILAATSASAFSSYTLPLRDTCTQLFVANLPYRVRWQDLKDLFRRAGTVLHADVALGPDGRSRGFGTMVFATRRAVSMFSRCVVRSSAYRLPSSTCFFLFAVSSGVVFPFSGLVFRAGLLFVYSTSLSWALLWFPLCIPALGPAILVCSQSGRLSEPLSSRSIAPPRHGQNGVGAGT
ncbi:Telomere maintenance protein [Mycena sanguinolenta]|uniref:Telomere maintenance protein n=1 Tax=Mycena sanguinolenta TaxID=230812 RepID=A0A8H6XQE2_9AGAR|nr:Telomere maintenance protein [Mycena sanguinolenta]